MSLNCEPLAPRGATRHPGRTPARAARFVTTCCLALLLLPLAACEPRFGEGNTTPRTPPTQPTPGTGATPPPVVPGQ